MKLIRTLALLTASTALTTTALPTPALAQDRPTYQDSEWAGLAYREVGPWRGGRVTTVTGVEGAPLVYYMGTTGGGVWKTTDGGHTWNNVSDGQIKVGSIGAVAVAASNPDIVYAGTGSSKIRSNVSIGRGIYKSTDAGETWTFIGLRDVGQIAAVRINPQDPDEVFVAATGNPFTDNPERGVYRTRDGGQSWTKVLFLSDALGAADIEFKPGDPSVLYATMWHGLRKPWTIISGSLDGGIFKSTDGGDTWAKLGGGLPTGLFGRANVGVSAADPSRLYALIEADPGHGLYRSDDEGTSWTRVNDEKRLITRPFYYTTLGVDPSNADIVYVGNEGWFKSVDAGQSFITRPVPHGDNHDVWINPADPANMIQANDGGANVSFDGGDHWSTQANQPTAELYQVAVDHQFPYRLYGAQQDNTTVIVPSQPLGQNRPDYLIGPGCETGPIIPKTDDPNVVWGGCKGQFSRLDMRTNGNEQQFWIGSESLYGNDPDQLRYRFQRVAPLETSPTDPDTVYYGSQYVHRSRNGGESWEVISPDLTATPEGTQKASGGPITRDATGEEVYSTLYAIRESRVQPGVIWAGSNDGLVWVTRDDGKTWANVTPEGLPEGGRIQNIDPGKHAAGTAYVAIYRYLLGDFAPYLYRTDDFGRTWTRLTDGTNGIAADEPTRVIREDPERPGLLYAGTEFGLYVSFDRGANWRPFQLNLPATPITDLRLAHGDLVLSTQGRGFWILDNLGVLRQLPPAGTSASSSRLYRPVEAVRVNARADKGPAPGEGPSHVLPGAEIDYYLAPGASGPLTLTVLDDQGNLVRRFTSAGDSPKKDGAGHTSGGYRARTSAHPDANPGMHRFIWDLRTTGKPFGLATTPESRTLLTDMTKTDHFPQGPMAVPGSYSVRIEQGGFTATQPLTVVEDPRIVASGVTQADLEAQFAHNRSVLALVHDTRLAAWRLRRAQATGRVAEATLTPIAQRLLTPPIRYSQPGLETHVTYLYRETTAADQPVGRDAVVRLAELRQALGGIVQDLDAALGPVTPAELNAYLQGAPPVPET
ncbi:WD40/YVTN/BNR-like repeat-containing protein [Novosphingobium profundi]|uniref:WD40/YVTN/BNR-like repeat-containing protein n=1 Tax=Novosphingobium profundi TaxID=1774954 RepID=UPI001CFEC7AB|nr:sialidase family protein [Novosphingobium profundi]